MFSGGFGVQRGAKKYEGTKGGRNRSDLRRQLLITLKYLFCLNDWHSKEGKIVYPLTLLNWQKGKSPRARTTPSPRGGKGLLFHPAPLETSSRNMENVKSFSRFPSSVEATYNFQPPLPQLPPPPLPGSTIFRLFSPNRHQPVYLFRIDSAFSRKRLTARLFYLLLFIIIFEIMSKSPILKSLITKSFISKSLIPKNLIWKNLIWKSLISENHISKSFIWKSPANFFRCYRERENKSWQHVIIN